MNFEKTGTKYFRLKFVNLPKETIRKDRATTPMIVMSRKPKHIR